MMTRNRIMQSLSCKTEALHKHFWQFWLHVATTKDFFCYSTQARSKANHEYTLHMCVKAQLISPVPPWRFSFSSLLYSLPKTMTHGITKSCQLNFPKSLLQRVESLLFHSFWLFHPGEKMSWEKMEKSCNCSVEQRTETIWVAAVEFSMWCGCQSLSLFPVLPFFLSQYLIIIFKVTIITALEKVWMLAFLYFFPCVSCHYDCQ